MTEHLEEVILILKEEASAGNLTELQYHDYVKLIRHAANRVFANHREFWREVDKMTKPLIKLPSMEYLEMQEKYRAKEEKLKAREERCKVREEKYKAKEEKYKTKLAERDAEIQRLQEIIDKNNLKIT